MYVLFVCFSVYEIYCQIGFHTTPSAHPNRCPPQCPSPTSSPSHPHQPSVYSQFFKSLLWFGSLPLSPSPPPWSSLKFLRIHIRVKTYGPSLSLYDLFHLALTLSSCIHVATKGHISFFLIAKQYYILYINHNFFIHSSVDGHLGCFHNLSIVESAAINIGVQVPLCISTPVSLG